MAIIRKNNNRDELDLIELVKYILKRFWIMVLIGILVGGSLATAVFTIVKPEYEASVRLYIKNTTTTENLDSITYSDITASIMLTETYLTIIDSDMVFDEVQDQAGLQYTRKEMEKKVTYETVDSTEIILITGTSTDPEEAALIANTYATVIQEKLSDIVEGSSVKILDHANVPDEPESRGVVKTGILGFLLGAVCAAFVVLLSAMNEKNIRTMKDLEYFENPVLGCIPEIYTLSHKKPSTKSSDQLDPLILLNARSPFLVKEAYNSLRTNLEYCFPDSINKTILVTSTMEHEGKTSVSINLARVLSEAGHNVLLIDGDLRRSMASKSIEVQPEPGLSDYLVGNCILKEIFRKITDRLYIVPSGTIPPNPNSLLSSEKMVRFQRGVSKIYDYIIIDAPPAGPISDPVILAKLCSGYVVVVRKNIPKRDDISLCLKNMSVTGIPMLGFIFTCDTSEVENRKNRKYGYYGLDE